MRQTEGILRKVNNMIKESILRKVNNMTKVYYVK